MDIKAMQQLQMIEFETNPPPENGQICLVELYDYSLLFDSENSALKKRFQTLTWKSDCTMEPWPYSGRFFNRDDHVVAIFTCRWLPVDRIIVEAP